MAKRVKAKTGTKRGKAKKKAAPKKSRATRTKRSSTAKATAASKKSTARTSAAKKSVVTKAKSRTKSGKKVTSPKKAFGRPARKKTDKIRTTVKAKKTTKALSPGAAKRAVSKRGAEQAQAGDTADQAAISRQPVQYPPERPAPKTHLSDEELTAFKELLLAKRRELAGDVTNLSREATNPKAQPGSDHSAMPIHMADLGSDNWEQEFTLGLIANERDRIRDIDEALDRIENKTYGMCVATRKRISRARLRAKPWAKYCIDYARAREEGRVP